MSGLTPSGKTTAAERRRRAAIHRHDSDPYRPVIVRNPQSLAQFNDVLTEVWTNPFPPGSFYNPAHVDVFRPRPRWAFWRKRWKQTYFSIPLKKADP
jgi:hypothetical protein